MKTTSKLFLVIITILVIGCSQTKRDGQNNELSLTGSGILVSQEVALSDFDQVEAGLYFDLRIHQGKEPHVVLTSDDNFIEYVQVVQSGSEISFGFKPGHAYDISGVTLKADITLPQLSNLELSGSSHAYIDDYQSQQPFEANLASSSSLTGEMQLESVKLNTSGSSYVRLGGAGANLALEACGANFVDLSEFNVEDAALEVSCNSKVAVNVSGQLETKASQFAQVTFAGDPLVKVFDVHESAAVQSK